MADTQPTPEDLIRAGIQRTLPPGTCVSETALSQVMPFILAMQARMETMIDPSVYRLLEISALETVTALAACQAKNAPLREALVRAERKLSAYAGVCKGDKELTGTVLPMVRAALAKYVLPAERKVI